MSYFFVVFFRSCEEKAEAAFFKDLVREDTPFCSSLAF